MKKNLIEGIGKGKISRIIVVKIKKGVDLLEAITEVVKNEKIKNGIIISGIGALKKAIFRNLFQYPKDFPVTEKDRIYLEVNQPLEIVSLNGHISRTEDFTPYIHVHFSASTVQKNSVICMGGHLTKGTITFIKVSVVILEINEINMKAKFSDNSESIEMTIES